MSKTYDLVVIGVGTAAATAANKCAAAGWSVAVVDELPYGGTCPLRGCDPKKMLRRGAEIIDGARRMRGKGIEDEGLAINWADLMAFKRSFTEAMPARFQSSLEKNGVTTLHGTARFVDRNVVDIDGERLEGRHILIATGAHPRPLDIPGAEHVTTSTGFLELEQLPRRILFMGGGFISFEFAHIAARAGAEVHVIDRGNRPLKGFDPDLVDKLVDHSRSVGINLTVKADLKSVEPVSGGLRVVADVDGEHRDWTVDLVVHGAGRVPDVERLDPDVAGIALDKGGVAVDASLRSTSNPAVHAAGDAAASPGKPLTPVASIEGKVAASNMPKDERTEPDYTGTASTVFTLPELNRVGLLEAEAKDQGHDFRVAFNDTGDWYSNMRVGESCAATKIIIDNKTDRILGAHLLGPGYAELINYFGLAMRLNLTTGDLKKMIATYPSVTSDLGSML